MSAFQCKSGKKRVKILITVITSQMNIEILVQLLGRDYNNVECSTIIQEMEDEGLFQRNNDDNFFWLSEHHEKSCNCAEFGNIPIFFRREMLENQKRLEIKKKLNYLSAQGKHYKTVW